MNRSKSKSDQQSDTVRVSLAAPRFWHGMRFSTYVKLLWKGRFRIHYSAIAMAVAIFFFSIGNSLLGWLQWLIFSRRIDQTEIRNPPIFIIGHWRSGTTLVHELMALDENLEAPTTYQCFAPCHFLISEWFLKPLAAWTIPKTRPMDNMAAGPDRPQEDEFAICALGAPSLYSGMAFPNCPRPYQDLVDIAKVTDAEKRQLQKALVFFAKALTLKNKKRLVLKSPTHTGRIEFLRSLFPDAKFIHVCRDPRDIVPSTVRLWRRLESIHGFQIPKADPKSTAEAVGKTLSRMYRAFGEQSLDSDDIFFLRYEDLVSDPIGCLRDAYSFLDLSGFEQLAPKISTYMAHQSDYRKNKYVLDDCLVQVIHSYCADYQSRFGYPLSSGTKAPKDMTI